MEQSYAEEIILIAAETLLATVFVLKCVWNASVTANVPRRSTAEGPRSFVSLIPIEPLLIPPLVFCAARRVENNWTSTWGWVLFASLMVLSMSYVPWAFACWGRRTGETSMTRPSE